MLYYISIPNNIVVSDDLLDHVEGRKVEQGTTVVNGIDQSSALYEIEVRMLNIHLRCR